MLLSLIDMTYIHQRPKYLALFWCLTNALSNVGLAFTPYITSAGGTWRAFYWVWFGPCILSLITAIIFFPETTFQRPAVAFDGRILAQSTYGGVQIYFDWDDVPGGKPELEQQKHTTLQTIKSVMRQMVVSDRARVQGWGAMREHFVQIIVCIYNPLIFWSLILNALIFGSMIITCATYVEVLIAPPYNFTPDTIGLAKFATGIGALLSYPVASPLTTRIARYFTRKNRGVREPEHYLPSLLLPTLSACASLALFGSASEGNWNWRWLTLFVGWNYFSAIALFTANTLWVTESFPRWRGPVLVVTGAGGYGLSFALSTGVIPWIRAAGFDKTYVQLAVVIYAVGCFGIPIYFWGKRLRMCIYSRWGGM